MEFRADLHCHSTISDGTKTPEEIIELAKERGLSGLSITDHDSVAAYSDDLLDRARKAGIKLVTGVEFSCSFNGRNVHILGYNFQIDENMIAFCKRHELRRTQRNKAILNKLKKFNIDISEEELIQSTHSNVIGRPHIANIMLKKGYVETFAEAFQKYLGDDKCAYVKGDTFSVKETIDLIHSSSGVAILAHPHIIRRRRFVVEVLNVGLDGLEGYYSRMSSDIEKRWIDLAKQKKLLITGGSDFHGDIKPQIYLGCSFVTKDHFDALVNFHA